VEVVVAAEAAEAAEAGARCTPPNAAATTVRCPWCAYSPVAAATAEAPAAHVAATVCTRATAGLSVSTCGGGGGGGGGVMVSPGGGGGAEVEAEAAAPVASSCSAYTCVVPWEEEAVSRRLSADQARLSIAAAVTPRRKRYKW